MWQLFDIKYELAWTSDEKGIKQLCDWLVGKKC